MEIKRITFGIFTVRILIIFVAYFVRIFGFRQQFYLQEKEYQDVLFNTISERLKDPQLEVSELACDTVAGFIKISEKTTILQLAVRSIHIHLFSIGIIQKMG